LPYGRRSACLAAASMTQTRRIPGRRREGAMTTLVGFYPGSFDPVTNGHLDVIERACRLVDHLVIAVGTHHSKAPLFAHDQRLDLLRRCMEPIGKRTN